VASQVQFFKFFVFNDLTAPRGVAKNTNFAPGKRKARPPEGRFGRFVAFIKWGRATMPTHPPLGAKQPQLGQGAVKVFNESN